MTLGLIAATQCRFAAVNIPCGGPIGSGRLEMVQDRCLEHVEMCSTITGKVCG